MCLYKSDVFLDQWRQLNFRGLGRHTALTWSQILKILFFFLRNPLSMPFYRDGKKRKRDRKNIERKIPRRKLSTRWKKERKTQKERWGTSAWRWWQTGWRPTAPRVPTAAKLSSAAGPSYTLSSIPLRQDPYLERWQSTHDPVFFPSFSYAV